MVLFILVMPLADESKRTTAKKETAVGESYEDWSDRMLKKAYAELALLEEGMSTDSW